MSMIRIPPIHDAVRRSLRKQIYIVFIMQSDSDMCVPIFTRKSEINNPSTKSHTFLKNQEYKITVEDRIYQLAAEQDIAIDDTVATVVTPYGDIRALHEIFPKRSYPKPRSVHRPSPFWSEKKPTVKKNGSKPRPFGPSSGTKECPTKRKKHCLMLVPKPLSTNLKNLSQNWKRKHPFDVLRKSKFVIYGSEENFRKKKFVLLSSEQK